MIPTAQNICGPLCGYTIEELRAQSMWAPDKAQVGSGSQRYNASGYNADTINVGNSQGAAKI